MPKSSKQISVRVVKESRVQEGCMHCAAQPDQRVS